MGSLCVYVILKPESNFRSVKFPELLEQEAAILSAPLLEKCLLTLRFANRSLAKDLISVFWQQGINKENCLWLSVVLASWVLLVLWERPGLQHRVCLSVPQAVSRGSGDGHQGKSSSCTIPDNTELLFLLYRLLGLGSLLIPRRHSGICVLICPTSNHTLLV